VAFLFSKQPRPYPFLFNDHPPHPIRPARVDTPDPKLCPNIASIKQRTTNIASINQRTTKLCPNIASIKQRTTGGRRAPNLHGRHAGQVAYRGTRHWGANSQWQRTREHVILIREEGNTDRSRGEKRLGYTSYKAQPKAKSRPPLFFFLSSCSFTRGAESLSIYQ
jgi:hypothetical protein